MTAKPLLTLTEEHLETGLRGIPVGYCTTSYVDPLKGLFYLSKPIADLSHLDPLSVIYLLYRGKEGSSEEVLAFKKDLDKRKTLDERTVRAIYQLPKEGHPMQLLITAVMLASMFELKNQYREDALNLIAKMPHLVACVINHHGGWGSTPLPKMDAGYMESFCQMIKAPALSQKEFVPIMNLFSILHFDHGGGNLSTFIGKAVASSLEDLYGSIAAAFTALAGSRHGRANQDCLEFALEVLKAVGNQAQERDVEALIRKRLAENKLVYGFGHAVLRVEDPRATVLYAFAEKQYPKDPLIHIALLLRRAGSKVLLENPKVSDPYPNVDAISGPLLMAAGFKYPEYFTVLFGLARAVGIAIQIVYERLEARGGKGTPIVRPKYIYKERNNN